MSEYNWEKEFYAKIAKEGQFNLVDFFRQKEKEIREEERAKIIQEIKELPLEAEGIKYEDVQWVRFLIISKLKENASQK
jgi:hypothetical protein